MDAFITWALCISNVAKWFPLGNSSDKNEYVLQHVQLLFSTLIMRNNAPAAVMLAVADYEQCINKLEDSKIELIAAKR
jgi:PHD/YefM family antitoxin component YafN of YafNO toxin-antitoxin module